MSAILQISWSFGTGTTLGSLLDISTDSGNSWTNLITNLANSGTIQVNSTTYPTPIIDYNKPYDLRLTNKCSTVDEVRYINDNISWACPSVSEYLKADSLNTKEVIITVTSPYLNNLSYVNIWLTNINTNAPVTTISSNASTITTGTYIADFKGISPGYYGLKIQLVATNGDTHDYPQPNLSIG